MAGTMLVFFLIQGVFVLCELPMGVARWRPALAHAWTVVAVLGCSPLFIEPLLRILLMVSVKALCTSLISLIKGVSDYIFILQILIQYIDKYYSKSYSEPTQSALIFCVYEEKSADSSHSSFVAVAW